MKPLADLYRPTTIDDVVGQTHILGKGNVLTRIIEKGSVPNLIFYGPSGTGKTTVSNIIANNAKKPLYKLNATTASISDVRDIIKKADSNLNKDGVILHLDEIQYFNKKQQQSLLSFMEDGSITLIASTTENPYFAISNAILSRSTIFEFKNIEKNEILKNLKRILSIYCKENNITVNIKESSLDKIATMANGDIRKSINSLDILLSLFASDDAQTEFDITDDNIEKVAQNSLFRYDRDGDEHYDILSAFQKSIRGSDANAAIHYLARLIQGGDLQSICRRLLVIATEDIGLAYPQAITITKSCVDSAFMLGFPEARIPLAQAVILLASCPKSNSAIEAVDAALNDIKKGRIGMIPEHLKDSHYCGAEKMGRGINYKYPHMYPYHWVEQQYLPDDLMNTQYYHHGNNDFENGLKKYWDAVKKQRR